MILKRSFGTLLSGKSVKQINYTVINRKRINDRERQRILNRLSIKDLHNDISGHTFIPESTGIDSDITKGLMHYTKILINNNLPQADIYRIINPLGHLKVSKLGTRSITIILSIYIKYYQNNHSLIKNVLKEIIRRFDELDNSELAHIAYSMSGIDKLKYDGLIENFTNRILLLKHWDFKISEFAKLLHFSSLQSNDILFDKCLFHLLETEIDSSVPQDMISSAYLIAKSLQSIDPKYSSKHYSLLESITNKCIDILCEFNDKLEDYLSKRTQNRLHNVVFDLNISDIETLRLKHLIDYLKICSNIGYKNEKYNILLNEYISKLLQINNSYKISNDKIQDKLSRHSKQPIHAFLADYIKTRLGKQSFPTLDDLIHLMLLTKSNKVIADHYIKIVNTLPRDIFFTKVLKANKQILYDNFSLNDYISQKLLDNIDFDLVSESNYYGFYQSAKSKGLTVCTFDSNILNCTNNPLELLVNEINYNMKNDGDYRFPLIYKDKIYNHCLSLILNNDADFERNVDIISAILTVTNEIAWSFTMSQTRRLLYVILCNINKYNKSHILIKNCYYRLYNTLLKSQLPLFNLHHQTYQLSLLYMLIQHNKCIQSIKDLDLEFFSYTNFTINTNRLQPIGPLVAANWFAKLSDLDLDYIDLDYGLGAYQKIESLGHPLRNHGMDILLAKSNDLTNNKYSSNDFTRFISEKPEIVRLIIENTLKYV